MRCDVTIVTYAGAPDGGPDDRVLAAALHAAGATTRFAAWNDPAIDWSGSAAAVVRSSWDYHLSPGLWRAWIDAAGQATQLINPPGLLRWNTDKLYLLELARQGVPVIPTVAIRTAADAARLRHLLRDRRWSDIVVKPTIGAGAHRTRRFAAADLAQAVDHAAALLDHGAALVQPFQPGVLLERERSLVMIGGAFSHAFTKPAFDGGAVAGELPPDLHHPSPAERELADRAIGVLAEAPVYARVDLVPTGEGPMLMELELIEPYLALSHHQDAPTALAGAILARIASTTQRTNH